jgi:DNA invertase Pin-like site-specific DNA recombinase
MVAKLFSELRSEVFKMNCALYARVSTVGKGQNPEMQLVELREFASKRGWTIVGEFTDTCSGSKDRRPQLDAMMQLALSRKVDVIVVWKLDRFGRSLKHLVNAIGELQAVGCDFVALRDNIDLTTPAGRLMFGVIAAMGQFERELIRERVIAGLAYARSKGQKFGRPVVRRERDKDAKAIRQMRNEGDSYTEIADSLGRSRSDIVRTCHALNCAPLTSDPTASMEV